MGIIEINDGMMNRRIPLSGFGGMIRVELSGDDPRVVVPLSVTVEMTNGKERPVQMPANREPPVEGGSNRHELDLEHGRPRESGRPHGPPERRCHAGGRRQPTSRRVCKRRKRRSWPRGRRTAWIRGGDRPRIPRRPVRRPSRPEFREGTRWSPDLLIPGSCRPRHCGTRSPEATAQGSPDGR